MLFLVSCLLAILPGQVFWDLLRVRFQVVSRWCWTVSRLDWVSGFTKRYIVTEYESPRREVFHHTRKPSLTLTLNCALIAWNIKCVNWESIWHHYQNRSKWRFVNLVYTWMELLIFFWWPTRVMPSSTSWLRPKRATWKKSKWKNLINQDWLNKFWFFDKMTI